MNVRVTHYWKEAPEQLHDKAMTSCT